jgi:hypothetical protein
MKYLTLTDVQKHPIKEIYWGAKGWIKAKCVDDACNTITIWNSRLTGVKCAEGKCGKCGGPVKRTVFSKDFDYIIQGA